MEYQQPTATNVAHKFIDHAKDSEASLEVYKDEEGLHLRITQIDKSHPHVGKFVANASFLVPKDLVWLLTSVTLDMPITKF